jgi:hypothetical protein
MKTYLSKELTQQWEGYYKDRPWCRCVRYADVRLELEARRNCRVCLGFGIPPIPYKELG